MRLEITTIEKLHLRKDTLLDWTPNEICWIMDNGKKGTGKSKKTLEKNKWVQKRGKIYRNFKIADPTRQKMLFTQNSY